MSDSVAVFDYGSRWLKAGYAYNFPTDEEPRIMTPCAVEGRSVGSGGKGGRLEPERPVRAGKIVNWDQFESLAYYTLYDLLGWELGEEGNIMICEPLLTGRTEREVMTQLMFEVFNVTGMFCQDQAALSLFAVGRTSGLVMDVGHDKIDIGAVTDGLVNLTTVRRLPYGGEDLTRYLLRMLQDPSLRQHPSDNSPNKAGPTPQQLSFESAEALKELCIKCAESNAAYDTALSSPQAETFKLPDGQEFTLHSEGLRLGEAFFQPATLQGARGPNITEAACDSAYSITDSLLRKAMHENILVVGGGSLIPGLSTRFLSEVRALAPLSAHTSLCPMPEYMPSPNVPRDAAWVGGAVLAKVALIQNHFIVKADYDEAGPAAVHRRCT